MFVAQEILHGELKYLNKDCLELFGTQYLLKRILKYSQLALKLLTQEISKCSFSVKCPK